MFSFLSILSVFVAIPILFFVFVFFLAKRMIASSIRSFGIASDFTTPLLIISVPATFQAIFHLAIFSYVLFFVCIVAIVLSTIEWKMKKELHLFPLFRRIARVLFLIFSVSLVVLWILGLVLAVWQYLS